MYDWEISRYIDERNGVLSNKEYLYICNTCPQINHIKYNSFEDSFDIWTDYEHFKFKVYLDE